MTAELRFVIYEYTQEDWRSQMIDAEYEEIGHRIMELRVSQKISREKLADMADISQKFLYEIEFGRKGFSVSILKNIAESLGTSCDYIVRGEDKFCNLNLYNAVNLFPSDEMEKVADVLKAVHELNEIDSEIRKIR